MKTKRISHSNLLAKEYIVSALLRLIYQKPLSSITISELCSIAGVSRMTFYRNYDSIEDIFRKHLDDIFTKYTNDNISDKKNGKFYHKDNMIHYFSYLHEYRDFMDGLIYCGFGLFFMDKLNEYIVNKWGDTADHLTLYAFSGALFSVFHMWSRQNYRTSIESLASQIENIFSNVKIRATYQ